MSFNDDECSGGEEDNEIPCDLFETILKNIPILEIGTPRQQLKPYFDEFLSVLESHPNTYQFILGTKQFLEEKCLIMRKDFSVTNTNSNIPNMYTNACKGMMGLIKEKHLSGKRKFNTHSNYYKS